MMDLFQGDCLEQMARWLAPGSIDLVLVDLPYGVTQNFWDGQIPLDALWGQYLRVTKSDAVFVFTAAQPFTSALVMSNLAMFKYDLVWRKPKGTGHLNAKRQPLRNKEDILIFARGNATYNPQMRVGEPYKARGGKRNDDTYGMYTERRNDNDGLRYPLQVLDFPIVERDKLHPSQKPIELVEYLVRTYSNPGDTVLDSCMGSGTTGIACQNAGREFVGIEMDPDHFQAAKGRLQPGLLVVP